MAAVVALAVADFHAISFSSENKIREFSSILGNYAFSPEIREKYLAFRMGSLGFMKALPIPGAQEPAKSFSKPMVPLRVYKVLGNFGCPETREKPRLFL